MQKDGGVMKTIFLISLASSSNRTTLPIHQVEKEWEILAKNIKPYTNYLWGSK